MEGLDSTTLEPLRTLVDLMSMSMVLSEIEVLSSLTSRLM
jgi:hypothetical protein